MTVLPRRGGRGGGGSGGADWAEVDDLRARVLVWVDGWLSEVGGRELFDAGEVGDRLLDLRREVMGDAAEPPTEVGGSGSLPG